MISHVEKLISANVMRRLPNTGAIVETEDAENIIGNNIQEAISYFNNDINKAKVSEFNAIYKSLPKNK